MALRLWSNLFNGKSVDTGKGSMLNYIYIGVGTLLVLALSNFATYNVAKSTGFDQGKASVTAQLLEKNLEQLKNHSIALADQQKAFNDGVSKLNQQLADHSQTTKIIHTNTEKEIAKPLYIDVCIPSSGVQLITEATRTLNSKRVP